MLGFDALGRLALGEIGGGGTALTTGIFIFDGIASTGGTITLVTATYAGAVVGNPSSFTVKMSTVVVPYIISGNIGFIARLNAPVGAYTIVGFALDTTTFEVPTGSYVIGGSAVLSNQLRGGTSRLLHPIEEPPRRRDRRMRTGLEPIIKQSPAKPPAPKPLPLPPNWLRSRPSPSLAPGLPAEDIDPAFVAEMPRLAQAIAEAHLASDHNYDEQDMADIADVLAALD